MLDYESPHHCPVYNRVIDADLCYDSILCLSRMVKVSALPALDDCKDIEKARSQCAKCPYSDLGGGMDEWDGEP